MTNLSGKMSWLLAGMFSVAAVGVPLASLAHMGGHGEVRVEPEPEPVETLRGKVLSLACYLKHGDSSKNYSRCSRSPLVQSHLSAALLTPEGSLYILIMDHKDAFKAVGELAEEQVAARGRTVQRGAILGIVLQSIEKAEKPKK